MRHHSAVTGRSICAFIVALVAAGLAGAVLPTSAVTASTSGTTNDSHLGRVVDTFQYSGVWQQRAAASKYLGDDHYSTSAGAYYAFRWRGTTVSLHGSKGPNSSPTTTTVPISSLGLLVDHAALLSLPTSGTPWNNLVATADGDLGSVDLADKDNKNAGRVVAAALVYARTGQSAYRDRVIAQLRGVPTSSLASARVLSVARQVAGYVIAADLVGYRDPAFMDFIKTIRTYDIGNHSRWYALTQTSDDTSSNWGAWALASRIAASRYLGDTADIAKAATTFRGFLGDRSAHTFNRTADFDPSWVCGDPANWVPINPAGCGDKDGAMVEDISRSAAAYPSLDDVGRTYSWEALGGATLTAKLLSRAGYPDVYTWSDKALLRAAQYLQRHGGYAPLYTTNQYIPWSINRAYGVSLGPVKPAGAGRQYGFTDWMP